MIKFKIIHWPLLKNIIKKGSKHSWVRIFRLFKKRNFSIIKEKRRTKLLRNGNLLLIFCSTYLSWKFSWQFIFWKISSEQWWNVQLECTPSSVRQRNFISVQMKGYEKYKDSEKVQTVINFLKNFTTWPIGSVSTK